MPARHGHTREIKLQRPVGCHGNAQTGRPVS